MRPGDGRYLQKGTLRAEKGITAVGRFAAAMNAVGRYTVTKQV